VKRCFYCGKQLRDESVTCFYCGRSLENVSQDQQVEKKSHIVIAALVVIAAIAACGMMLINHYKGEEAANTGANVQNIQKANAEVVQAPGTIDNNPERKAKAEEMQRRFKEAQQQHQQIMANAQEHQQQARNNFEEMEQQQKQRQIDMEINQYEAQQRQNEINEANRSRVYQRTRVIYFETVRSK
jgi:hypothetical protein